MNNRTKVTSIILLILLVGAGLVIGIQKIHLMLYIERE